MKYRSGKAYKQNNSIRYSFVVSFFVVIFFWVFLKKMIYPSMESSVFTYSGIKHAVTSIPESFSFYLSSREKVMKRDKELEIIIERLENDIALKNARLQELGDVVTEFGDTPETISRTIVMYPLMNDVTRIYSTILLSKGYKDGVEKDSYVYVRGLQPVCIIKESYTSTSLCQLLSASGMTTEAVIMSSSSVPISITLTGRGGGTFLGDVARDTPLQVGDDVYLKSDQSMKVGKVIDIINNNQDTSWRVFISGFYNPVTSSIFYTNKK